MYYIKWYRLYVMENCKIFYKIKIKYISEIHFGCSRFIMLWIESGKYVYLYLYVKICMLFYMYLARIMFFFCFGISCGVFVGNIVWVSNAFSTINGSRKKCAERNRELTVILLRRNKF